MATKKKTAPKRNKPAKRKKTAPKKQAAGGVKKWSAGVTKHSNALDLDKDVFKKGNATQVAHSLERSADKSTRKKSDSFRSAMSMLTFYINRAGKNLPESKKKVLERAKDILREDNEKKAKAKARTR